MWVWILLKFNFIILYEVYEYVQIGMQIILIYCLIHDGNNDDAKWYQKQYNLFVSELPGNFGDHVI